MEQIQYKNLQFEVWDLGGQANLRPSWATYYKSTDALIMVVDSTDRARIGIAKVCSSAESLERRSSNSRILLSSVLDSPRWS